MDIAKMKKVYFDNVSKLESFIKMKDAVREERLFNKGIASKLRRLKESFDIEDVERGIE